MATTTAVAASTARVTAGTVEVDALWPGADAPGGRRLRIVDGVVTEMTPLRRRPGRLVVGLPPLVNAHDHGRGLGTVHDGVRDAPLDDWIAAFRAVATPDSQHEKVATATARMAATGTGGVVLCVNPTTPDTAAEVRRAAAAAAVTGIRAAVAHPLSRKGGYRRDRGGDPARAGAAEAALDSVDALADEVAGDGIDVLYHPVGPQWVDEELLVAVGRRSAATGRGVHMHLLETAAQRAWADDVYPDGLLHTLDAYGLLGPRTWLAHGTHLRQDEIALVAERGARVALNVSSNMRLASGIAPIAGLTAAGATIGIGLDGMTLDDDLDGWGELRLLRGLLQAQRLATVPAAEVLTAATTGAPLASAAGAGRRLAVGDAVDLAVHDLSHLAHLADRPGWPVEEIAVAACGAGTCTEVWAAGRRIHPAPPVNGD